jgi:Major Facilitator Superfamily
MARDRMLVLAACYLTILSVGENSTAIMAALPAMRSGLGLGPATIEWIVNAYLLASAVFIILGGEAADQFGARRSSAAGIALFALASLIIALAVDGVMVVGARALQGVGAAFAVAGTLAAVSQTVPDWDRGRAIGAWTGSLMLGFSIGPLVGGAVTHYAGWRVNFWLNVALMLPAALALWLNPGSAGRDTRRVDWLGLGLLAIFMVTLVQGLRAMGTAVAVASRDPPRSPAVRLRPVSEPEFCPRLRAGLPAHVRHFGHPALLQPFCAVARRARQNAHRRGPFAHAAVGGAVRLRADGAVARDRGRPAAHDGGRVALARARLRPSLGFAVGRRLRGAHGRPLHHRRRHRAPLRLGPEDRPSGARADPDRKRIRRAELVQLSGRAPSALLVAGSRSASLGLKAC